MKTIEDFLKPTQKQLFKMLAEKYTSCTVNKDNYILVEGNAPLLLVAHLDTVHKEQNVKSSNPLITKKLELFLFTLACLFCN